MKRQIIVAALAATLGTSVAMAQSNSTTTPATGTSSTMSTNTTATTAANATTPAQFVPMAAQSNMLEIQMAKAALDKSQDKQIRQFANRMVKDHTKAGNNLKQAVEKSDAKVDVPMKLDAEHQQMLDKLQSASGSDFNKQYVDMNVMAHEKAVNLFQTYSTDGQKGAVKQFATKTLPTLKEHLEMIQKIQKSA